MPLLWISGFFLVGIWLGGLAQFSPVSWLLLGLLGLPFLALPAFIRWLIVNHSKVVRELISSLNTQQLRGVLRPANKLRGLQLGVAWPWLVAFLCLGASRMAAVQAAVTGLPLADYNDGDGQVVLEGVVSAYPDERDPYTGLTVEVNRIQPGSPSWVPIEGKVLVRVDPGGDWHYGDRVRVEGFLATPAEDEAFSYRDYLQRKGIGSLLVGARALRLEGGLGNPVLAALYALRTHARSVIYSLYPDPEASLLTGILLGLERGIPSDLVEAYQITGTAHIIAISGFNMTLLAGISTGMLVNWLGKRRGAIIALILIALYTVLVGAQAAVVRAAIMAGMGVFGAQFGRRQNGVNSLVFVSAVMAAIQPYVLWDAGFQLSFSATLGLVLFGTSWPAWFERASAPYVGQTAAERLSGPVGEYFLMTLAAQLMTLPVILYHFGRLSLISLVANPIILPLQPAVMVLGGLSLLVGMVYLPAGQLIASTAWPLAALTNRIVSALAQFPGAEVVLGPVTPAMVLLFYSVVLGWTFIQRRFQTRLSAVRPALGLGLIILLSVQVWRAAGAAPDGLLHVTLLEASLGETSGEAILIQTPEGRFVLVNGGASQNQLSQVLGERMAARHGTLDALVIAGVEDGQIQALQGVLGRYQPSEVIWAGETHASRTARYLYESLVVMDRKPIRARTGMALDLGRGAQLVFLSVRPRGGVLLLEWDRFRLLLPCGLDFEAMESLLASPEHDPVTGLLLAGNGYGPLNPGAWIEAWDPDLVLLSVSRRDHGGLPDAEVLESVQDRTVLRTDEQGWIELSTDGQQLWVEAANEE